ncbi:murein biosynthesis integral membrane protein MurJ [Schnuerera sp. xch1]|uniref:murein biosynthesis integral membrane protein MurJ n=1 Tax=Schnuerera sp. xch1 TaxID=2874283 RepID=UPI001CBC9394|nr:murein biosynthesis integral membrane protein MurJ [Schnuerera sp. xch1]MBZ2175013.1 murein biosynthesis integral membrane protein MurJ [Schnuerera sp. xch1]
MTKARKVAQSAATIAIFTLISKFLGFIREVLIASQYGSGYETDTYFVAMTATTIIMTTIGTSLNTTLIPIFTEIEERKGRKGKLKFLNNIFNVVFFTAIILALLGFLLSPVIIKILAKGFEGEQFDLAVKLNRIGLPIIIFLGFTYIFSGYLHSSQIFGPPAIMGIPYNFVFIFFLLFMADKINISDLMLASVFATSTQFLIQIPAIRHQGFRYRLDVNLKDIYISKTFKLIVPVILGSAVQKINTIIDKTLASSLVDGSISALNYAARINDVIVSVFIMAVTTVIFPMLSKAFSQQDNKQIRRIMGQGINIILIITVPATIGILILAEPIVRLFFERGEFTSIATNMTSSALFFYSLGLVGISLRLMLNKVFYSFQDTKTPMMNGALAVGLNIILNLIFVRFMDHSGLALATSISVTLTSAFLFLNLRKKIGPIGLTAYIKTFIKTLAASLIMGVVVYFMFYGLSAKFATNKIIELLILLLSIGTGALIYFILCIVFKVENLKLLKK